MTVIAAQAIPVVPSGATLASTDDAVAVKMVAAANPFLPTGGTSVTASSGNVANASAVAALPAVVSKTNYLTSFTITASGSTAALVVNATITGLLGGTMTLTFTFPAGVAVAATPIICAFDTPIPASAANTAITLTLPAGGAGNTNAAVSIQGYVV
jgi:hypothetical protein